VLSWGNALTGAPFNTCSEQCSLIVLAKLENDTNINAANNLDIKVPLAYLFDIFLKKLQKINILCNA
jgi:hypothetical protein